MPSITPCCLRVDVGDGAEIAVSVFAGADPGIGPTPVVFLFPGAGLNRVYFDLCFGEDESYSQARWMAARGITVVTVDHLGVGESTVPIDETVEAPGARASELIVVLSSEEVDRANDAAVRTVLDGLRDGTLHPDLPRIADPVAIGAGHSMGGHVVTTMQANHGTFAGIVPMGTSMNWVRLSLGPGYRQPFRSAPDIEHTAVMAGIDWARNDHWDDAPAEIVAADTDQQNPAPWRRTAIPSFAGALVGPYPTAREAASVRVPVLLVYGEGDVTPEPLDELSVFRAAPSVALTVVPKMSHGHNFASTREIVWTRLELFAREVVALQAVGYPR